MKAPPPSKKNKWFKRRRRIYSRCLSIWLFPSVSFKCKFLLYFISLCGSENPPLGSRGFKIPRNSCPLGTTTWNYSKEDTFCLCSVFLPVCLCQTLFHFIFRSFLKIFPISFFCKIYFLDCFVFICPIFFFLCRIRSLESLFFRRIYSPYDLLQCYSDLKKKM